MLALGVGEPKPDAAYQRWIAEVEPSLFRTTCDQAAAIVDPPLISVVVPTYNTPAKYFEPLVQSMLDQVYVHWELCVADGSNDEDAAKRIAAACRDPRIRYRRLASNEGISGNTNRGLELATGPFIALLDHDDTLSPYALAEVALAIDATPDVDLVYTDEDKLSDDGSVRSFGVFKPDWSPDMLLGGNYITHLTVLRRSLLESIGGVRSAFDGAQDFDLVLRASEQARRIVHIPKVLYHWRLAEGSTAVSVTSKGYAGEAGRRAVESALARRGVDALVHRVTDRETFYRVEYALPGDPPRASIIVAFGDAEAAVVLRCIDGLLRETTYPDFEIVLVAAEPSTDATRRVRARTAGQSRVQFVEAVPGVGIAGMVNAGRAAATGEILVVLHADIEVAQADWLAQLVGVAVQGHVGAVSPQLRYPSGQVQHAGVVLGLGAGAGHPWRWRGPRAFTFFGTAEWPRDFLAPTGACMCVRTVEFDAVGGLVSGQVDPAIVLGLQLAERGLRNVYWPYAVLTHAEELEGERDHVGSPLPDGWLRAQPGLGRDGRDPYFNPNLDPGVERIALRRAP